MRICNKKPYYLKTASVETDAEGGKYAIYSDTPIKIEANIWPASGQIQAEIYGQKLKYILNMLYDGNTVLTEGDGICVYVPSASDPDYRIISIKGYSHLSLELEKL